MNTYPCLMLFSQSFLSVPFSWVLAGTAQLMALCASQKEPPKPQSLSSSST